MVAQEVWDSDSCRNILVQVYMRSGEDLGMHPAHSLEQHFWFPICRCSYARDVR
jgi:hypothetical protein